MENFTKESTFSRNFVELKNLSGVICLSAKENFGLVTRLQHYCNSQCLSYKLKDCNCIPCTGVSCNSEIFWKVCYLVISGFFFFSGVNTYYHHHKSAPVNFRKVWTDNITWWQRNWQKESIIVLKTTTKILLSVRFWIDCFSAVPVWLEKLQPKSPFRNDRLATHAICAHVAHLLIFSLYSSRN